MNKLGFAIKIASQGASNAIECNRGPWTNKVVDIREYLKLFNGLQGTDNIVTFISFDEGGCFLTLLRAISGRVGDFLSGWVYIPNTIDISGLQVCSVYNYVRGILSQSNLNDSLADINSYFATEYPTKSYPTPYTPSSGEGYGVRYLGHYSMQEILDGGRFQHYYSKYKSVFLLERGGEVSIAKENAHRFQDLTNLAIEQTCILKAPTSEELLRWGQGVKIVFKNNVEFRKPISVKKGSTVQLYAVREGFDAVSLPTFIVANEIQGVPMPTAPIRWQRRITTSWFDIRDEQDRPIANPTIYVNNTCLSAQGLPIGEGEAKNALVVVQAKDCDPFTGKMNLLYGPVAVTLKRKTRAQGYSIIMANGKPANITLESKFLSRSATGSPLKAYSLNGNTLQLSSSFVWRQRLFGFGAAVAFFLLLGGAVAVFNMLDDDNTTKVQTVEEPIDTPVGESNPKVEDLTKALDYLDGHDVWDSIEMEEFPCLHGLFDDLNNFNLDEIVNKWQTTLGESEKICKIAASAEKNIKNGWDPNLKPHSPRYNEAGDERINITNYINWIDQDQSKAYSNDAGAERHADAAPTPRAGQNASGEKKESRDASPATGGGKANNNEPVKAKPNEKNTQNQQPKSEKDKRSDL